MIKNLQGYYILSITGVTTLVYHFKGNIRFYCSILHVSRQGFYKYLSVKDRPWKYQPLVDAMMAVCAEDEYNDTYGRIRMYQALRLKKPDGVPIPSEKYGISGYVENWLNSSSMQKVKWNHQGRSGSSQIG